LEQKTRLARRYAANSRPLLSELGRTGSARESSDPTRLTAVFSDQYNLTSEENDMTPEERLTRIETLLQTTAEQQARLQQQLGQHAQQIEKQNDGIRSLIVVARTGLDSLQEFRELQRKDHEEWSTQMKELRDAQAATDERLNVLIDTVDRIIRHRNGKE
jgi:DNA repair exonuclease SbcCD ATPase subunit